MELKVGDYVRTKSGRIGKIINFIDDPNDYYFDCYETNLLKRWGDRYITEYTDIKSSPSVIDLIKNEDLLKIIYPIGKNKDLFQEEITQVIENEDNKLYIKLYTEKYVFLEDFSKYDIEIKSIVTKEQFESMEYRIGEDE